MALPFLANEVALGDAIVWLTSAVDPSAGAGTPAPVGSFCFQTSTSICWQKMAAADTAWVSLTASAYAGPESYVDGDVTISGNQSLTRDMYYRDLVVDPGAVLWVAGNRINARSIVCDGEIAHYGQNGSGTSGGTAASATTWGSVGVALHTTAGANGGTAAGTAAQSIQGLLGATNTGGAGGAAGANPGGAGGTIVYTTPANMRDFFLAFAGKGRLTSTTWNYCQFGAGGGGGAGFGGLAGGGGGGGGAGVWIAAREITGAGSINARGGNGANAINANTGGGGGAGGGIVVVIAHYCGIPVYVTGGSGGAGLGIGSNGLNGGSGAALMFGM